jgi:hypothetical protein
VTFHGGALVPGVLHVDGTADIRGITYPATIQNIWHRYMSELSTYVGLLALSCCRCATVHRMGVHFSSL